MRALLFLVLACLFLVLMCISGCAAVKATLSDPVTGGTWLIKEAAFGPDQVYYCTPAAQGPVRCREAQVQ